MPPKADLPPLTIRAISAVGVEVPMTHVLGTSRDESPRRRCC